MSEDIFSEENSESNITIITKEHKLLPLAHRLSNIEKIPTRVIVWKRSYENAWEGMIDKYLLSSKREIHHESVTKLIQDSIENNSIVLHDVKNLEGAFDASKLAYTINSQESSQSSIRLGFWWNGEKALLPHILVYDIGAWPGGMGRQLPSAVTLICIQEDSDLMQIWESFFDEKAKEFIFNKPFKGLVNAGLIEDKGELLLDSWEMGWPDLHTQAFMGAVEGSWGQFLGNNNLKEPNESAIFFDKKFTVALNVSVPPWPGSSNTLSQGRAVKQKLIDLNPKLHEYVYWHDVAVDKEVKLLYTAGLDGLLGVVHAKANCLENASQKALGVASLIGTEEKQFRSDICGGVRLLEAQLEEHYGVSF